MKRIKSLLCALTLACAFSVPVLAGEIPVGGFCETQACTQQNQPVDGGYWRWDEDALLWIVTQLM